MKVWMAQPYDSTYTATALNQFKEKSSNFVFIAKPKIELVKM